MPAMAVLSGRPSIHLSVYHWNFSSFETSSVVRTMASVVVCIFHRGVYIFPLGGRWYRGGQFP